MKTYKMKLLPQYFNYIKNGTKRLELRLNDEKRKDLEINDIIIFEKLSKDLEYLNTKVKKIYKYKNFDNLVNDFDIELIADKNITKDELLSNRNRIDLKEVFTTKIDNIKNYILETNQESFMKLADEIYELTIHLNGTYPGYKEWFYDKQIKGCLTPNRNIIFVKNEDGKIIALSCLKKLLLNIIGN